jgi:F0F1-type ATP synthase assembly protein I
MHLKINSCPGQYYESRDVLNREDKKPIPAPIQLAKVASNLITFLAWMQVFVSPMIAGAIAGGLIYLYMGRSNTGLIYGLIALAIGICLGILLAEYVRRKIGLVEFISRRFTSADFDKKN